MCLREISLFSIARHSALLISFVKQNIGSKLVEEFRDRKERHDWFEMLKFFRNSHSNEVIRSLSLVAEFNIDGVTDAWTVAFFFTVLFRDERRPAPKCQKYRERLSTLKYAREIARNLARTSRGYERGTPGEKGARRRGAERTRNF